MPFRFFSGWHSLNTALVVELVETGGRNFFSKKKHFLKYGIIARITNI